MRYDYQFCSYAGVRVQIITHAGEFVNDIDESPLQVSLPSRVDLSGGAVQGLLLNLLWNVADQEAVVATFWGWTVALEDRGQDAPVQLVGELSYQATSPLARLALGWELRKKRCAEASAESRVLDCI